MSADTYRTGQCPKDFDARVWATLTDEQKKAVQHLRGTEERAAEKKAKDSTTESVLFATFPLSIFLGMKDYFAFKNNSAVVLIIEYLLACGLFLGLFSAAYVGLIEPDKQDNKAAYIAKIIGALIVACLISGLIYKALGII